MKQVNKLLKQIPGARKLARIPVARKLAKRLGIISGNRDFLLEMLPKNSVGAEIGVHTGGFSALIINFVKPSKFHLIDPWKYEVSETFSDALYGGKAKGGQSELDARYEAVLRKFQVLIDSGKVEVNRGTSEEVAQNFPDEYFDWVYIDGNHLYEYAKQDMELYLKKVKVGGYLTGDDYTEGGWWKGGVKKAVDEMIETQNVKLVEIRNSQFILKKTER
ncbi:class I SAM-dependent methyltransferase [Candidatus Marithioploca araucensis]|uniref:Class I SAM-dependent methyltransferase n=1 Tax=Candidatus Marithioploca araucensis TaxID=70273 RepID=A0ABT7VQL1_9GAMM|nr:class I SAM-dependent methyltransferase [Candidatus Marithioploca araucensis]